MTSRLGRVMATPLRVLLIEGSEGDASMLLDELRLGGYEPSWSRVDTPAALRERLAEHWSVALCSWDVAGLSGAEAVSMVRLAAPEIPIIAMMDAQARCEDPSTLQLGVDEVVFRDARGDLAAVVERSLRAAEMRAVRRRADEALRESGERFTQAFEKAPIGMAIVGLDGLLLHVNPAFCEMFGYTPVEMAGIRVWSITHPDDMMETLEQLRRLVEGESGGWYLEKRFFHRDGSLIWARSHTWLVRAADGTARYVVSQLQDVTKQKQMEEQMRAQQTELAHVLRVATMGQMVALIAHEINQPLGSIANYANALVHGLDDAEATRATAGHIASEAVRASDVIRRLRVFLRKGESKRELCTANELVRDALRLMQPEMRQHAIVLQLDLEEADVSVEVDRVQLVQVILNLLRNSVEAMSTTTPRVLGVRSAVGGNGMVEFCIRDSGIGLPPVGDIFEAFFTTKPRGLGLGLSISRSLVEAHGGEMRVEAHGPAGTVVTFTLPRR